MSEQKFISKHTSTEIEAMLDKVKQDMQTIQYTQSEINTLLGKIQNMTQPIKTSDLTNDSGFITNVVNDLVNYYTKTQTYTKEEVNALVSQATSGGFEPVSVLPTENISTSKIYLVPNAAGLANNIKDEYINLDGTSNGWELIGSTALDLSGYVTSTNLSLALADYVSSTAFQTALNDYYTKTEVNNLLANISSGSGSGSNSGANYSLIERQVGTWVDGKPVYAKLFTNEEYASLFLPATSRLTNGTVICNSMTEREDSRPSNAFDGNESTKWVPATGASIPFYNGLTFSQPVYFTSGSYSLVIVKNEGHGRNTITFQGQIAGSDEWIDITEPYTITSMTAPILESLYPTTGFSGLRIYSAEPLANGTSWGDATEFYEIYFYGSTTPPLLTLLKRENILEYIYAEYTKADD